jgi:ferritin-like metal-binding protein YciE
MRTFEQAYIRTLRHIYDAEQQLFLAVPPLCTPALDARLTEAMIEIAAQSQRQLERLETIFRVLYKEPRGEAAWAATALLREAWEAAAEGADGGGTEACAAALLALKRYELTLYEMLLRWSEQCDLYEALPAIRRSIAEELLQASILSEFAFDADPTGLPLDATERRALH